MQDTATVNPRKLFVGNLPFSTTEGQLQELFSPFGEVVSVKLITDRATGRSKGFAFVEFVEESAAQTALEEVNGQELDGRAMAISVARPPAPREGGDRPFRGGGGGFRPNRDRRGGGDSGFSRGGYRN